MRMNIIVKAVVVSITIFIASITGCTINLSGGRNFNHRAQHQVQVSSQAEQVDLIYADLQHTAMDISAQDTDECSVTADFYIGATSQEIAEAVAKEVKVELVQNDNRLDIVVQKPALYQDDYYLSAKMKVVVPVQAKLQINTTHGDCCFKDVQKDLMVKTTHANIKLDGITGVVTAATTHGNINVANTRTPSIQANSTHGKISLNNCDIPQVNCCTTHACIALKTVSADTMNLRTSHGPIELADCTAKEAALNTTHGAIRGEVNEIQQLSACTSHAPIGLRCMNDTDPDITVALNTTHNNIKFTPPTGYAGQVKTSTTHGSIHSDLPILVQGTFGEDRISGTIGEGTGSITLNTTHGNIKLKSPTEK